MPLSVIFYGTPDFSVPTLQALCLDDRFWVKLVVTQPDKPAGRGKEQRESPIKAMARTHHIPILQPASIKKEIDDFLKQANQYGPFDIGVVIAFGQILPLAALQLPANGSINIHASLLPRWRGAAPIQRSILAGDKETGVCLMRMEEGLDTGPVFSALKTSIASNTTFGTLHDKLAEMSAELCKKDLIAIAQGTMIAKSQDANLATYAAKIEPELGRIDWNGSAEQIQRLVYALSPTPAAFTIIKGERLKIFKVAIKTRLPQDKDLPSAIICHVDRSALEVCCGDQVIAIEELQLAGRKRMPIAEFLKGAALSTGQKLG